MLRLDFYLQHLIRQNATGIDLISDEPVRFKLAEGDRQSSKALDHAQIVQLVQEAAPPDKMDALRASGSARFRHSSESGLEVEIAVEAHSPRAWRVRIRTGESAAELDARPPRPGAQAAPPAAAPSPQPVVAAVAAPPAPRAAVPAPAPAHSEPLDVSRVQSVPGEPVINRLLRIMIALESSDLHLTSTVVPMVRRHGEMTPLAGEHPLDPQELANMIREIAPDRNRQELEATNDTDFAHAVEGLARFRVNVFFDRFGIGAVMRQIPFQLLTVDQLGLPPRVIDLCWLSKGLVVVTGPTGSGKSTTLATLVDFINMNRSDHIITIEDPIEFVHTNKKCLVNQREIGTHTQSFKRALRAALREDPDIVLVGEMRDLETIAIAIETAETGHLVFGTLHTTSAPSTVDRIIDQFPADQQAQIRVMLSESLRGVIAQVLCKKKGGGRVAAYEVMVTNAAVSNLIREGKTYQLKSVMQTGRNLGMQTMSDHILDHVRNGLVEPEEAYIKSNDKSVMKEALEKLGHKLNL